MIFCCDEGSLEGRWGHKNIFLIGTQWRGLLGTGEGTFREPKGARSGVELASHCAVGEKAAGGGCAATELAQSGYVLRAISLLDPSSGLFRPVLTGLVSR